MISVPITLLYLHQAQTLSLSDCRTVKNGQYSIQLSSSGEAKMNIVSGNAVVAKVFRGIALLLGPTQPSSHLNYQSHNNSSYNDMSTSTEPATTTGEDTRLVSHTCHFDAHTSS